MSAARVVGRLTPSLLRGGSRSYGTASWYAQQKATLEEVSFLPMLQIMKDLPEMHSIAPAASAFRAVRTAKQNALSHTCA